MLIKVSIYTLYLWVAYLSVFAIALMFVRPLYSFFVRRYVLPSQHVAYTWRVPFKQWINMTRKVIQGRLLLFAALAVALAYLYLTAAHISVLQTAFLLMIGSLVLVLDALIPPRYYATEKGIVTKTPGIIDIIRWGSSVNAYFVSWRRVKTLKVEGNHLYVRIVCGKGRPHPVVNKHLFDIRDITFYLPPNEQEAITAYAEKQTRFSRNVFTTR